MYMTAMSLRKWAKGLRQQTLVVYHVARDPRTPWFVRVLALAVAAYALSPVDLIPDLIDQGQDMLPHSIAGDNDCYGLSHPMTFCALKYPESTKDKVKGCGEARGCLLPFVGQAAGRSGAGAVNVDGGVEDGEEE